MSGDIVGRWFNDDGVNAGEIASYPPIKHEDYEFHQIQ